MEHKKSKKNIVTIVILLIILLLSVIYYISNRCIITTEYVVEDKKIPESFDGYKILQLSDLHDEEYGKNNEDILEKVEKINPDIIVMTGDMITSTDLSYEPFYTLTENLVKSYDIYYIVGNHEQAIGDEKLEDVKKSLNEMNKDEYKGKITIIDNDCVSIEKDNDKINMYGMWFHLKYYVDIHDEKAKDQLYFDTVDMEKIFKKPDENEYNILLTHNPVYFDTYSKWGANLVLSGHMHGGMINIPFKGGLFSPEKEWFPKYYGGKYKNDDKQMIVSKGLGNGDMGFRMFNSPELVVITLSNK